MKINQLHELWNQAIFRIDRIEFSPQKASSPLRKSLSHKFWFTDNEWDDYLWENHTKDLGYSLYWKTASNKIEIEQPRSWGLIGNDALIKKLTYKEDDLLKKYHKFVDNKIGSRILK